MNMLSDELYYALLDVEAAARHEKLPGPLAQTMLDVARKGLELWRRDEKAEMWFQHRCWAAARACGFGLLEIYQAS